MLRPTFWLWDQRIPAGSIVLGPGREGIGKSLFCAWLTARVTRGELAGIHHGQPRAVIYAATEDSWERTIAGRLIAAGADLERVYRVEVEHIAGHTVPLSLPKDCDGLAAAIVEHDVVLLVLDPLISAVDSGIDVNSEKLRDALEPLAKMADQTGAAVFGLAHFNKASAGDVLSRITGSRAFAAVARAAIAFARDHLAGDGSCVISQAKNNLGPLDLPSLRYRVDSITLDTPEGPAQWGQLVMLGETDTHVDDLLNDTPAGGAGQSGAKAVRAWLLGYLAEQGGAVRSTDAFATGELAGYTKDQIDYARKWLFKRGGDDAVHSQRIDGRWWWHLTGTDPAPIAADVEDSTR